MCTFSDQANYLHLYLIYCPHCNQNVEETTIRTYSPTTSSKYLLIYVNMFHFVARQAVRINSRITNFNMDDLLVPSSDRLNQCRFRIQSSICRNGETLDTGHYYTYTRRYNDDGWVKISDTYINNFAKFTNSQNNVQLFFAELI